MNTQPRTPPGRPDGGQFTSYTRAEVDVDLNGTSHGDPNEHPWAVTTEEVPWHSEYDPLMSRRARRAAAGPYLAAVPPHITDLRVDLEPEVTSEAVEATSEIARFDAEVNAKMTRLLGSEQHGFAPLAAVLLRSESASSSQIEQITAGAKSLALEVIGERTASKNAALVASNAEAMERAIAMADDLSVETILGVHQALLEDSHPDIAGRFRQEAVWIGGRGSTPHTASYVAPRHERVPDLMGDLVDFTRRTDVAPLVHAALAHAQFETIHPFPDGNGRVGRALVHAMLRSSGTTRQMTVPVSAGLLADVDSYYTALGEYRRGDLTPIVEQFSVASFRAVANGRALVADVTDIYEGWTERLKARSDAASWKALPHLLGQPAVTVNTVATHANVTFAAAQNAVDQMVEAGILTPVDNRSRNRAWVAVEITTALDEFAARAGRRTFGR